jgi:hypothetical protein
VSADTLCEHLLLYNILCFNGLPDGPRLASCSDDWEIQQGATMAQFTQLNLGAKSGRDNNQVRTGSSSKSFSKSATAVCGGALVAAVFLGVVLLGSNGCSKSEKVAVTQPSQNMVTPPVTASPVPAPVVVAKSKPAKKKHAKIRTMATYSDPTYGVSFRYPNTYNLKTGDEPQKDLAGLGPAQMNFVQPGGNMLAAVELPRNAYPGSNVSSAFFAVSVNPNLSEAECSQFSSSDASGPDDDPDRQPAVKVGSFEFNQIEETLKDSDSKYYHVFQNGTCYEFGLGLGNAVDGDKRQLTEAEYEKVFDKLQKILETVKIEPSVVSESPKETAAQTTGEGKD